MVQVTLYSQYFRESNTRRLGRKISRKAARNYSDARLEEILRSLRLKFEVRDARYPRIPWEPCKMYIVDSNVKKSTLIKMIERKLS
ncbi:hypothetical protein GCM10007108_16080 [Thermogymnomonas acidicola]|uniref:Signal recognition particle subunit SRP19 n=1 Tax=Thermogymnomonas acidicola TaxID=399579 RepID=A0AA37BST6_9ARCH|nr:signal recognition particle subunit SRP19/SEC65 family protein [Thermogymnomonas acidicola]GGM78668.1 hypothetical protein GCM10007108_16080 [Thermogymnomonas acidicola]